MGTGFFVHHRIVSAVKRVGFVSDRMSYIVLRGRWCKIMVLNVHAPSEDKRDDSKYSFTKNWSRFLIIFLGIIRKSYSEILMQKWGEREFSNRQLGMRVYIRIVMIKELE